VQARLPPGSLSRRLGGGGAAGRGAPRSQWLGHASATEGGGGAGRAVGPPAKVVAALRRAAPSATVRVPSAASEPHRRTPRVGHNNPVAPAAPCMATRAAPLSGGFTIRAPCVYRGSTPMTGWPGAEHPLAACRPLSHDVVLVYGRSVNSWRDPSQADRCLGQSIAEKRLFGRPGLSTSWRNNNNINRSNEGPARAALHAQSNTVLQCLCVASHNSLE